jgi:hypothetical protein
LGQLISDFVIFAQKIIYQYGGIVEDCPNYIFGPMGYEEGPIDKDLRPPMDLWGPIKTSKTEIRESSEPLAKRRKLEKPKFAFVEYDINEHGLFFGILPTEKLSRDVSKLKKWSIFRLKRADNVLTWVKVWVVEDYDQCVYTYFKVFEKRDQFQPYDRSKL